MNAVRLSADHAAFVEQEVATGGYADASEYVARLIDARAQAQNELETSLLEGLEGPVTEWTEADGDRLRRLAVRPH